MDEIISGIPEYHQSSYEVNWAIALGLVKEKRYSDAETWLKKAFENSIERSPFLIIDYAYYLINEVYSDEKTLKGIQISISQIKKIVSAIQHFIEAWEIVQNDERLKKQYFFVLLEIIKAFRVINNKLEFNRYLSLAIAISPNNEVLTYFKGLNELEEHNSYIPAHS